MIKTAITGAETPIAGELIRILVNHPDVDIVALVAPGFEGKPVQSVHHGLIGDTKLSFSSSYQPEKTDVVFIADSRIREAEYNSMRLTHPEMKIISLHPIPGVAVLNEGMVFAVPEINRKPLVRGAMSALVPSPMAAIALVALYPLAMNMLLPASLTLEIEAPEDIIGEDNIRRSEREISDALCEAQRSFSGNVKIIARPGADKRGMKLTAEFPCPVGMDHIMNAYDTYDDHHSAFTVMWPIEPDEAIGTQKCITSLSKNRDGNLRITAVADSRMRGGAGDAVHILNLLFGLHEQTGLALKASVF